MKRLPMSIAIGLRLRSREETHKRSFVALYASFHDFRVRMEGFMKLAKDSKRNVKETIQDWMPRHVRTSF